MKTVGVPRELKLEEHRVGVTPDGVAELVHAGARVIVEAGAGIGAAIIDEEYRSAGAEIVPDPVQVWERADIVAKVKEPQQTEAQYMRAGQVLFTYLHLAAYPEVGSWLCDRRVSAIGYETVQTETGALPLLAPMSEVAGRMAPQIGAHHLERTNGGRGVLLSGAPGVSPGKVVVLGAGNVGWNAAVIAAGMGAQVLVLDRDLDRLRWVDQFNLGRITTLASNRSRIAGAVAEADLVIGAVLVAGGRAPTLVSEEMVMDMRPGAVIVDVAVDQGGCVATTRETNHDEPTYRLHEVIHYAVGNIPGAVPRTSTYALANATLPYLLALATADDPLDACRSDPSLGRGLNVHDGHVMHPAVAEALGVECRPFE